jgi:hypothetical protein
MKPVKSDDPRKPKILAALKAKAGVSRITNVREASGIPGNFAGDALEYVPATGKYINKGTFEVSVEA